MITKELFHYVDNSIHDVDWQDAIRIASAPLIKHKIVTNDFVDKLINETIRLGPYYILAPYIALGHISPDSSILQNSLSLTIFSKPIPFKDDTNHDVKFLFVLTSFDGNSHMEIMSNFASLISNELFRSNLHKVKNYQDWFILCSKHKE